MKLSSKRLLITTLMSVTILLLVILFSVHSAFAQEADADQKFPEQNSDVQPANAFAIPGESFDHRTGNISHDVIDYVLPGANGMDIVMIVHGV